LRKTKRKCACIAKSILTVRIKAGVPLKLEKRGKNENREYRKC
jgi:hypothetical protein